MPMRKKRAPEPQTIENEGSETEAFTELVEVPKPPEPEPIPEPVEPPEDDSVDNYLRRQVYKEMYGTEEPTHYERTLAALKSRL